MEAKDIEILSEFNGSAKDVLQEYQKGLVKMNTGKAPFGVVTVLAPEKALLVLKDSLNVLRQLTIPLFFIFLLMVMINLLLKPAKVVMYLGKGSGTKAMLLSAAAGIISAGPIYTWHP